MSDNSARYIPALGFRQLTPFYDPLLRWVMQDETFKRRLVVQSALRPGMRVLDLGCGTGTLTILMKQMHPEVDVVGLDGDPAVLEVARSKANRAGVSITLDQGMAFELPYPDGSFDRVLSSLVFHHLTARNKQRTLVEIFRVLRLGGEFHIVDFGRPRHLYTRLISPLVKRLEVAGDNIQGLLPGMIQEAGFEQVFESAQYATLFGDLSLYWARK